jgi:hypothetical protein
MLATLLMVMLTYRLLVVPWIEPRGEPSQGLSIFSRSLPSKYWWQQFFPEGSWQTQNPTIINTDRGILLAKELTPVDEKTWKLEPLTMIVPHSQAGREAFGQQQRGSASEHDMWIVSAEQGAKIHFEEPLLFTDIAGAEIPSIERGELSGEIEITRQTLSQADARPWRIRTSDLTINRTQLSTRREVLIEWDDSIIRGRELRIVLRSDLLGTKGSKSPSWGPLDELELYHVDEVEIGLPPGGIWSSIDAHQLQVKDVDWPTVRQQPARISATCGGRFAFDFKRSVASLQNGVHVKHLVGDISPDEFLCERVAFFLQPPSKTAAMPQPADSDSVQLSGIQLNRVEAIGADSVSGFVGEKWVDLKLPAIELRARSKRLLIDLQKRRVEFVGQLDHPDATRSTVVLQQSHHEFRSPHIEYQSAPTEEASQPSHLGWLVAKGPGELETNQLAAASLEPPPLPADSHSAALRVDENQQIRVRWQESLRMAPAAENDGSQWIELLGGALVESAGQGFLASERLEIWLSAAEGDAPAAGAAAGQNTKSFRPRRIYSSVPTVLSTAAIEVEVSEMDTVFRYETGEAAPGATKPDELQLSDSQGNPMFQWISPPIDATASLVRAEGQKQALPNEQQATKTLQTPVAVSGEKLQALIVQDGSQTWIDRMQIEGPVKLSQTPIESQNALPWIVDGEQLLMSSNSSRQIDLQVSGTPARMTVADGSLVGATIRINQAYNLAVIDHPGEFTIPKSLLAEASETRAQTAVGPHRDTYGTLGSVQWISPPHCKWHGRMLFNGSVVRIEGNVEFDAAMRTAEDQFWWIAGTSQRMDIHLAEPMRFDSSPGQEAKLDRIVLSDQVHIRASQLDPYGEKRSREEIHVPTLSFDVDQAQLVGHGPGWIQSWFLSEAGLGNVVDSPSAGRQEELQGAFLAFRDSMVAELDEKQVTFDGKIELLAGPIASWDDEVRPSNLNRLTADQMLLNSDQLKVYDTQQLGMYVANGSDNNRLGGSWEFKATGNVAFNGNTESGDYRGYGYQLTYTQSKELLLLRGDGRTAAYVERSPRKAGDNFLSAHVDSVAINPKTLEFPELRLAAAGVTVQQQEAQNARAGIIQPKPTPQNIPNPRQNFFDRR